MYSMATYNLTIAYYEKLRLPTLYWDFQTAILLQ